jgi:hypothetical protein
MIVIEPSFIKTGCAEHASFADHSNKPASLYGAFNAQARRFLTTRIEHAPGPEVVAEVVLRAASARRPKVRHGVTATVPFLLTLRTLTPDGMFDAMLLTLAGLRRGNIASANANEP